MGRDFWNVKAQAKVIKNKFSVFLYMTQIPQISFFKWSTYYKNLNQKLGLTHDTLVWTLLKMVSLELV